MMQNKIKKICVIGSGVMGSTIAALVANSMHEVLLLDIVSNDSNDRNAIVKKALEKIQNQSPPPLTHPSKIQFITIGNLEDDLPLISECDLIIEVIIEKLEIKHQLYNKIIRYLKEDAIITSNTSTLPLKKLKEPLADSVKSRFLITHFFNPPRYMELLELVTDEIVDNNVILRISDFLTITLGKTIVKCNDTPGFIANRVGCFLLELVVRKAILLDLNPVIIDQIFTNIFKLPNTGIFGLYDLIGHDVMKLISTSLIDNLPDNDDYRKIYLNTPILDKMLEHNLIGRKGDGGFYRISLQNNKKIKELINLTDLTYKPIENNINNFTSIQELLTSDSNYGSFFREVLIKFYLYLTNLIPSVTNNIYDIDLAIKLGYSWKFGPFELITYHIEQGFNWIIDQANVMKLPLSNYLSNHYYKNIELDKFQLGPNILKYGEKLLSNNSSTLVQYQNHLIFTIHTKMNCLNKEIFHLLLESINIAESKQKNLYFYPQNNHFSSGADLKFIITCIEENNFNELEEFLKLGQQTMMKLKYSSSNIISCALGVALGGGCEILLHSDFIIANQGLNAGLVEVGVGLIPSWGGLTEMLCRANNDKAQLIKNISNIISQNKSSSADYFIIDYNIKNILLNINRYSILDEALKLDIPKKTPAIKNQNISLPNISLVNELDISHYNKLQIELLSKFQKIIIMKQLSENTILKFERDIFMELAKRPNTLDQLKVIVKN